MGRHVGTSGRDLHVCGSSAGRRWLPEPRHAIEVHPGTMNRWGALVVAGGLTWTFASPASPAAQDPRIQVSTALQEIADFTLTDQDGRPMRFSELRGRNALVIFGLTHCPNICPGAIFTMKSLADSIERSGEEPPAVVLISIDGERDTPEVLKKYLAGYSQSFIGLTGDPKSVRRIAAGFKAVFFKGLPYDDSGNYQVEHTSQVYLVDSEGRLRATFFDAPVESMAATTRQLSLTDP